SKIPDTINAQRVQGDKLLEALFMRRDANDHYDIIAWAREAVLDVDLQQQEPQLVVKMRHSYISDANGVTSGSFDDEREWRMELPPDFRSVAKSSARAMTWWEILDDIDKKNGDKQDKADDAAAHQAQV